MRVKNISVKGLFGVFDHEIPLENPDRVMIILGPNGFGKTVMLKMISAIAEGNTRTFEHTPFEEFSLNLKDGTGRVIRRARNSRESTGKQCVKLELLIRDAAGNMTRVKHAPLPSNLPETILAEVDSLIPSPYTLHGDVWVDDVEDRYTLAEILQKFPRAATALPAKYRPRFFSDVEAEIHVFFVETNRLGAESGHLQAQSAHEARRIRELILSGNPRRPTSRVRQYSVDLVQKIRSVLADYAKHSQESDRTLPERRVSHPRLASGHDFSGAALFAPSQKGACLPRLVGPSKPPGRICFPS